jgi:hypothetical protein
VVRPRQTGPERELFNSFLMRLRLRPSSTLYSLVTVEGWGMFGRRGDH